MAWNILLKLEAFIRSHENIESLETAAQYFAVFERRPMLFLDCANRKFRKLTPELSRHVFIEQNSPHAICANAAGAASSRNATACSRVTLGNFCSMKTCRDNS